MEPYGLIAAHRVWVQYMKWWRMVLAYTVAPSSHMNGWLRREPMNWTTAWYQISCWKRTNYPEQSGEQIENASVRWLTKWRNHPTRLFDRASTINGDSFSPHHPARSFRGFGSAFRPEQVLKLLIQFRVLTSKLRPYGSNFVNYLERQIVIVGVQHSIGVRLTQFVSCVHIGHDWRTIPACKRHSD